MNKKLCCAIFVTVFGVLVIAGGIFTSWFITQSLDSGLNDAARVPFRSETEDFSEWISNDYADAAPLYWAYYIFSTVNAYDIVINGANPIVQEKGPFTFRQYCTKFNEGFSQQSARVVFEEYCYRVFEPTLSKQTTPSMSCVDGVMASCYDFDQEGYQLTETEPVWSFYYLAHGAVSLVGGEIGVMRAAVGLFTKLTLETFMQTAYQPAYNGTSVAVGGPEATYDQLAGFYGGAENLVSLQWAQYLPATGPTGALVSFKQVTGGLLSTTPVSSQTGLNSLNGISTLGTFGAGGFNPTALESYLAPTEFDQTGETGDYVEYAAFLEHHLVMLTDATNNQLSKDLNFVPTVNAALTQLTMGAVQVTEADFATAFGATEAEMQAAYQGDGAGDAGPNSANMGFDMAGAKLFLYGDEPSPVNASLTAPGLFSSDVTGLPNVADSAAEVFLARTLSGPVPGSALFFQLADGIINGWASVYSGCIAGTFGLTGSAATAVGACSDLSTALGAIAGNADPTIAASGAQLKGAMGAMYGVFGLGGFWLDITDGTNNTPALGKDATSKYDLPRIMAVKAYLENTYRLASENVQGTAVVSVTGTLPVVTPVVVPHAAAPFYMTILPTLTTPNPLKTTCATTVPPGNARLCDLANSALFQKYANYVSASSDRVGVAFTGVGNFSDHVEANAPDLVGVQNMCGSSRCTRGGLLRRTLWTGQSATQPIFPRDSMAHLAMGNFQILLDNDYVWGKAVNNSYAGGINMFGGYLWRERSAGTLLFSDPSVSFDPLIQFFGLPTGTFNGRAEYRPSIFTNYSSQALQNDRDETYELNTGIQNIVETDILYVWEGHSPYEGWCGDALPITGRYTPRMPPAQDNTAFEIKDAVTSTTPIGLWNSNTIREIPLLYQVDEDVKGVKALRFGIDPTALSPSNPTFETPYETWTFTDADGVSRKGIVGTANMFCPSGGLAYIILTKPNFLDSEFYDNTTYRASMIPDGALQYFSTGRDVHLFVEPLSGAVIKGDLRLQINYDLRQSVVNNRAGNLFPTENYKMAGLPTEDQILPILWIHKYSELTDKQADDFDKLVVGSIDLGTYSFFGGIVGGGFLTLLGAVLICCSFKSNKSTGQFRIE